jgi:hypothetical protein
MAMSAKNIWYGVLEAGEKTSPVVRDTTLDARKNNIWLYNYVRDQFIEYSQAIVEPKLRELAAGDVSLDDLDNAFKAALNVFSSTHKTQTWTEKKPATSRIKKEDDEDTIDLDISDYDDAEEFIDDD